MLFENYPDLVGSKTRRNAALYYRMGQLTMQLNVNNLAGRTYLVRGYGYIRLFPGTPRNFLFTLSYSPQALGLNALGKVLINRVKYVII